MNYYDVEKIYRIKKKQQQMLYFYFLDNKWLWKQVVVPTLGTRIPDSSLITHFMKYI